MYETIKPAPAGPAPAVPVVKTAVSKVTNAGLTKNVATMVTNAFGLVAALAWSDAIKAMLQRLGTFKALPFGAPFIQAFGFTVLAYMVSITVGKLSRPTCTRLCAE